MNILTEKNEPLKGKALYDAAQSGCIFVENGLAGVKDADGNVIIPPSYGQICWEGDTLAMKHYYKSGYSFRYLHPSGGETSSICRENEFGIFTQDGKVGLDDGRIRIPAEYDEVFPWGNNSDVYYLRKGSEGSPIIGKGLYIMEIKASEAFPLWLTELLDRSGIFPRKFSKYRTAFEKELAERLEQ